ncbi:MAG: 2OG-Fe(II) oxygenase [Longimicrobiales bacterium]|nr:2OG-Fe(II) oxygenase [Longimicrobiales bacterium]
MQDSPATTAPVAHLLARVATSGTFAASCTAAPDTLRIEVEGVGPLSLPVSEAEARRVCEAARPARYGQGEDTLLDTSVRDTWEIPGERLRIDEERWGPALDHALDELRAGLGLDEGCRLVPQLHNLLVYGPGQFFLPHRDSEKSDEMIATLVVTLPSTFTGGTFEVEHAGETLTFQGSKEALSFVAFYPDCTHQVRPVKRGHRVALTFTLSLDPDRAGEGGAGARADADTDGDTVVELARRLRAHFETRRPPRWAWRTDAPDRDPPARLVHLLDHQYSLRGLAWHRLKGDDAPRVQALRAAADGAGCEAVLAIAEIHETWGCFDPEWEPPRGRHRRWTRERDAWEEEVEDVEPPPTGPDRYELQDLHDSRVVLTHWMGVDGSAPEPVHTDVEEDELCHTTATAALEPYASEYEGFMGNWGNTMDRWYRRAAVVLWPRERGFAVRAEAAPRQALDTLVRRLKKGEIDEVRERVRAILPEWARSVSGEEGRKLFGRVLRVAEGVDDPELAEALLAPLRLAPLTPRRAAAFAALVRRYEEGWTDALLARWSAAPEHAYVRGDPDPMKWIEGLPALCDALVDADPQAGWSAACLVLWDRWEWISQQIDRVGEIGSPTRRDEAIREHAAPILALLEGVAMVGDRDLAERALAFLCSDEREVLLPCLVGVLRASHAADRDADPPALGLDRLRERATLWLHRRLAIPTRAPDDWSITPPPGCDCELCGHLAAFLALSEERVFEWPLAKAGRKHLHQRIDQAELPVRHETRRTGSPYTLVLTKTDALFEEEASERWALEADLAWLEGMG